MHSKYIKEQCKTVGKLIIFFDQPLGRGPNGIVHDGRNENVIPVAVKSVKKTKDNGPFIKQLRSLYRVLKKVGGSDETVSYVTMEEDVRTIYIATQRCGIDSSKVLKNGGFKNKRKIIKALCKAIKFLHLRGIVHGKLHPGNVRFDEKIAKLVDFGVNNLLPGTHVKWMSPEQRKADKSSYEATAADDIFSLAILIYYIYTNGKHLFGDPSTQEENIRKNNPKFTGCNDWELKHLILAMITKNPKNDQISIKFSNIHFFGQMSFVYIL